MAEKADSRRDVEISSISKDRTVTFKFEWTIENFFKDGSYVSPKIELPGATLEFNLTNPCNEILHRYNPVLSIKSSSSMRIWGNVRINELKQNLSLISLEAGENDSVKQINAEINTDVVKCVFDLKANGYIKKNFTFTKLKASETETKANTDQFRSHLQSNIQNLWQNHPSSDIRIQVDNETIPAHKLILSASSPVFACMFQSPTIEVEQNVVNITDVGLHTMKLLIGFMYGHYPDIVQIENLNELYELYYASDKYEVLYLRDKCGEELVARLTVDNVFPLIDLADRHRDCELKKQAVSFCCLHFEDIVKKEEWKNVKEKFLTAVFKEMTFKSLLY